MDIRIIVVGCGAVFNDLYKKCLLKLQKQNRLKVVALVDSQINIAKKFQQFFTNASIYSNIIEALSLTKSNLTIVTSPPAYHAEHTIASLKHGNHVLCEKPMAITTKECVQMIEAAKSTKLHLAIGMVRRFYPSFVFLKNILNSNQFLGKISFSYREGSIYGWPITSTMGFLREKSGGGVLADVGSHVLDTLQWLFGPISINSFYDDALSDGIETNCIVNLNTPFGKGLVQLSWDQNLKNEFYISFSNAEITINLKNINKIFIKSSGSDREEFPQINYNISTDKLKHEMFSPKNYQDFIYLQIIQLIRAIKFGESVPTTGEEGKAVISLIEKCYEIAKPIDMEWLPQNQQEQYKTKHWSNIL